MPLSKLWRLNGKRLLNSDNSSPLTQVYSQQRKAMSMRGLPLRLGKDLEIRWSPVRLLQIECLFTKAIRILSTLLRLGGQRLQGMALTELARQEPTIMGATQQLSGQKRPHKREFLPTAAPTIGNPQRIIRAALQIVGQLRVLPIAVTTRPRCHPRPLGLPSKKYLRKSTISIELDLIDLSFSL